MSEKSSDHHPDPYLSRLLSIIEKTEKALLTLLVLGMIALATLQILLRNIFSGGFAETEPLLRLMVLWLGLLGAITASRNNKHIAIDVLTRYLRPRSATLSRALSALVVVIITGILAWYSGKFVWLEYEAGSRGLAGMPAWVTQIILPVAFSLMALRYLINSWKEFMNWFQDKKS